jgi:hypothetical protein
MVKSKATELVSSTVLAVPGAFSYEQYRLAVTAKRAALEAKRDDAEGAYTKAAFDADRGVPGAVNRRAEAAQVMQETITQLAHLAAAEMEAEAEQQVIEAQKAQQLEAKRDARSLTANSVTRLAAVNLADALAHVMKCYEIYDDAYAESYHAALENPRLREHAPVLKSKTNTAESAVAWEISRLARPIPGNAVGYRQVMPTGHVHGFPMGMHHITPLVEEIENRTKFLDNKLAEAAAARELATLRKSKRTKGKA